MLRRLGWDCPPLSCQRQTRRCAFSSKNFFHRAASVHLLSQRLAGSQMYLAMGLPAFLGSTSITSIIAVKAIFSEMLPGR